MRNRGGDWTSKAEGPRPRTRATHAVPDATHAAAAAALAAACFSYHAFTFGRAQKRS